MKIRRLKIDSYRHLENLEFDFTYQSGEKKGQPLEKICLIGQSATGKTSILELIKDAYTLFVKFGDDSSNVLTATNGNNTKKIIPLEYRIIFSEADFIHQDLEINVEHSSINLIQKNQEINKHYPTDILLYYFTSEIIASSNFDIITQNPTSKNLNKGEDWQAPIEKNIDFSIIKNTYEVLEFNEKTNELIWNYFLQDIAKYREKLTQKGADLINMGLHADYKRIASEMEQWKIDNPNPSELLGNNILNPILKKLHLEVDPVDTSSHISLKHINNNKPIPTKSLSTGSKQLILNSLPLYKLETKETIILIDEPERSLYPDVQIELMDHYQRLAPEAQFIVATHSPFIAAAFEPDERFILYFDDEGKVAVKKGSSPIGDDPNDILKSDFGLTHLMNEKGIDAYRQYIRLKEEMASEKDSEKKDKLMLEVVTLGNKYKF